jgi:putative salt-induced outer membrane protein YdiY
MMQISEHDWLEVSMRPIVFPLTLMLLAMTGLAAAQTPPLLPLWDAQVGASFVGTSGNSETSSTGADFSLHRRWPVWRLESTATAVRTSDHGVGTAERYLGGIRVQRKLGSVVGLSSGWRGERDKFAGINFRSVLDAGLSWALVRQPRWILEGLTAIAWNHERPTVGVSVNDPIGVLQAVSRVPFGAAGDTTQRFTFYPNFHRRSAYRSEAELSAQAAMNSHLALKLGYLFRRSNEPVAGFKKTDNTTTASIVLRWRAAASVP